MATFDYLLYELGNPFPDAKDEPYYFHSKNNEYPVRYLENNADNDYARAKVSCYCGVTNMTLAFQTDLSAFAFEYFYTPYTSPFEDGTGGDISARIFYGNRPKGVYNHDSLGGCNVVNWCRPDYPRGVMTENEVTKSITPYNYPNGIDPLTSTAIIGKAFLNKLGFSDTDLGIVAGTVDQSANNIGSTITAYTETLVLDDGTNRDFSSYNETFDKTNKANLDSSDSILAAIPAPETEPGLNSNIKIITPTNGKSKKLVNRWGDYIFYPYSFYYILIIFV